MSKCDHFVGRKWYFGNIHTTQITYSVLKRTFNLKMDELFDMLQFFCESVLADIL